jgi:hypothetical protein
VQQRGRKLPQPACSAINQRPNNWLGGRTLGELIQVALDGDGGVVVADGNTPQQDARDRDAILQVFHVSPLR